LSHIIETAIQMNQKVTGFKLLKVRAILWQQLKILAAKNNTSMQELTERAIRQWLKYSPNIKTNDNEK
jgi:hypothetical protein